MIALQHLVIQAILKIRATPFGVADLVRALRSVMLPVQAERGLVSCGIYQQIGDENVLVYIEEWTLPEDLDEQIRSNRFSRLLALMETAAEPPVLEFRFVNRTRGLDYVEAVRHGVSDLKSISGA